MGVNMQAQSVFDSHKIRAVIGLGNPGSKYYKTRHNIGFRVVDELVRRLGAMWHTVDHMENCQARIFDAGPLVYFIKPTTFMNNSGQVISLLQKKGIKPDEILVIHDELEKPFGHVGIRFGGSARGHNGLRSIIERMGADFWRLRVGIGRPDDKNDVGNYVLESFSLVEEERLNQIIDQAARLIFD